MLKAEKIQRFGPASAGFVFIQMTEERDREMTDREILKLEELPGASDRQLIIAPVEDWNRDLAPWKADPVFGKEGFGDGAQETLEELKKTVISSPEGEDGAGERRYFLCGYSLAGLFALWAAAQTDIFSGIVAASPSVWYPSWISYAREHSFMTDAVYLSLGDREEAAKNPLLASVGACINEQQQILLDQEVPCFLEWNPGNHFKDADIRMAKGIRRMQEYFSRTDPC